MNSLGFNPTIVRRLAAVFLDQKLVPPNKPGDAAQLAVAVAHQMDYLLTWNYAHLANPVTQARGEVADKFGWKNDPEKPELLGK